MDELDPPTQAIALMEQMLSEAIKGEPDWALIAQWARRVEDLADELQD